MNLNDEFSFISCKNLTNVEFDPDIDAVINDSAFEHTSLEGITIQIFITYNFFGYHLELKSIEFLGDDVNLGPYCINKSVLIVSFPNACRIGLAPLHNYQEQIRIYVLPLAEINLEIYLVIMMKVALNHRKTIQSIEIIMNA